MSDEFPPTELTRENIDAVFEKLMNSDIPIYRCIKCQKEYFEGYGCHMMECDECFFSRFPKEQREAFFRSFLE